MPLLIIFIIPSAVLSGPPPGIILFSISWYFFRFSFRDYSQDFFRIFFRNFLWETVQDPLVFHPRFLHLFHFLHCFNNSLKGFFRDSFRDFSSIFERTAIEILFKICPINALKTTPSDLMNAFWNSIRSSSQYSC